MSTVATPKATITWPDLTSSVRPELAPGAAIVKLKHKKNDLTSTLTLTDRTAQDLNSAKDLALDLDYKLSKKLTVHSAYDFGAKKYKAGATLDTNLLDHKVVFKSIYTQKDDVVTTDATIHRGTSKAVFNFKKTEPNTAKVNFVKDDLTIEPTYSFGKKSIAVSVQKKVKENTYKATYDFKSEEVSLEVGRKPVKLTVKSAKSKSGFSKPVLSAVFEKEFSL